MFEKLLKELGILTPEQVTQVVEAHNKEIADTYVPRTRLNEEVESHKKTKATLDERDKSIEGLKKIEGATEELNKQLDELSAKAKQDAEDWEKSKVEAEQNFETQKKSMALSLALASDLTATPIDIDYVLSKFDLAAIKLDESGRKVVSGLEDQKKALMESNPGLFTKTEVQGGLGWQMLGDEPAGKGILPPTVDTAESFGKAMADSRNKRRGVITTKED